MRSSTVNCMHTTYTGGDHNIATYKNKRWPCNSKKVSKEDKRESSTDVPPSKPSMLLLQSLGQDISVVLKVLYRHEKRKLMQRAQLSKKGRSNLPEVFFGRCIQQPGVQEPQRTRQEPNPQAQRVQTQYQCN